MLEIADPEGRKDRRPSLWACRSLLCRRGSALAYYAPSKRLLRLEKRRCIKLQFPGPLVRNINRRLECSIQRAHKRPVHAAQDAPLRLRHGDAHDRLFFIFHSSVGKVPSRPIPICIYGPTRCRRRRSTPAYSVVDRVMRPELSLSSDQMH